MRWLVPFVIVCVAAVAGCSSRGPSTPVHALSIDLTEEGKVRVGHVEGSSISSTVISPGQAGHQVEDAKGASVKMEYRWPDAKTFEAEIDFDSKGSESSLKLDSSGFVEVTATRDGKDVPLPAELPAGKYRIVVKGRLP